MNASIKSALKFPQSSFFHIKSAFFHSTAALGRGRRNPWTARYKNNNNSYNRRAGYRRNHFKQNLMRNANAYVDHLFESWHSDSDQDDQSAKGPSWFRKPHNGSGRNSSHTQGRQKRGRRGFSFCEDDDDVQRLETIFQSAFSDRFFFWSFVNDDYSDRRNSSRYSNSGKTSWKRRQWIEDDDEYEYMSEDDTKSSDLASERIALGLSASGPLKLDDVKNAYRSCALKWHPDRHLGTSKAAAEEKFKLCTSAYQSLCDRLAMN
ncbi:uncharacterized protein LOC110734508 [Chenopodium quinoa]|uniref:J domain-containing protein n=1 Tax=Chenopodium quinoa TaxID=63459 RepID=A0A803LFS1_CHEQI|nr:uncharacterized protein LOC110734508 [Chenopodium quinoa]